MKEFEPFQEITEHKDWVVDIKCNREGDIFVSAGKDGYIFIYQKDYQKHGAFKKKVSIEKEGDPVIKIAADLKQRFIFAGYESAKVLVFNYNFITGTFKTVYENEENTSPITSMNYNAIDSYLSVLIKDSKFLIFADLNSTTQLLDISGKELISADKRSLNVPYIQSLVKKVNPDDMKTYVSKQRLSLHSLCILEGLHYELEYLLKTVGLEKDGYTFEESFHPLLIAIDMDNIDILDTLGKYLMEHNSLIVIEELFFASLHCASEIFKNGILQNFFNPPNLMKNHLPSTIALSDSKFPYFIESHNEKLGV